ncbi:wax ester/triacylglycerol synthase domain-containing protein [Nocardia sp. NPDC088792]|uniref:wax ester/triacylglycerol synthase domain-containing protein n=1 Tax=Nocardia sp. NPDC088792 TaxID=3364332 RepID=UPI003830C096
MTTRLSGQFGAGAWNLPRQLNALDSLMWRCEANPRLRSPLIGLFLLDRAPDWDRLLAGHDWATRMVPRLRERPVTSLLVPASLIWTADPEFDMSHHLRRVRLPGPAGRRELLGLVETMAAAPFDPNRPPWESVFVEGLRWEGKSCAAAWILRFHHSMADGQAAVAWLTALLSRGREPRHDKPQPPIPPVSRPPSSLALLPSLLGVDLGSAELTRLAEEALRAALRPRHAAVECARMLWTAVNLAPRPVGQLSPLLSARGTTRQLDLMTVPLDGLRAAAGAAGVSVNDAFAAAMLGGLRRYHELYGAVPETLAMAMPIQVRGRHPMAGNRFGGMRVAGPMAEKDPLVRLSAVHRVLAAAHAAFDPAGLDLVTNLLNRLPTPLVLEIARRIGLSFDLQLSQIAVFDPGFYVSGAAIEDFWCFGPVPGCAVTAIMISRRAGASIGVTADAASVTDLPVLMGCMEEGFKEFREGRPRRRGRSGSLR